MELGIKNKYALVTGCSKNIGKAIATHLSKQGVNIIGIARSKNELLILKKEIDNYSNDNHIIVIDLLKKNSVNIIKNYLIKKNINIDIVVHNLGGSLNIKDMHSPSKIWKMVWDYNLGISIDINNFLIPKMQKLKWGRIVHLSTYATTSNIGYAPYVSAKGALESYVKSVSKQISRDNIIMSCASPGLVNLKGRYFNKLKKNNYKKYKNYINNHIPIERMSEPEEIASVITFLCSIHSSYMSGSIIKIDGVGN